MAHPAYPSAIVLLAALKAQYVWFLQDLWLKTLKLSRLVCVLVCNSC